MSVPAGGSLERIPFRFREWKDTPEPDESEAPTSLRRRGFFMSRIAGGLGGTRHWPACREGFAAVKHVEDKSRTIFSWNFSAARAFHLSQRSNCQASMRELARSCSHPTHAIGLPERR